MNYPIKLYQNRLIVFHESKKRRMPVGELSYNPKTDKYEFVYDEKYVVYDNAIPLSPELNLFKLKHVSKKGKLFAAFIDRIPERENPAYPDYCASQGISVDEDNPIVLLGSIGRKGPSTFIFEPVYYNDFNVSAVKQLRETLQITQHDFSEAFAVNVKTLQRLENGTSQDANTLRFLNILFEFPEVALWQLKQSGGRVSFQRPGVTN